MTDDQVSFDNIWQMYIESVRPRIKDRAAELAKQDERSEPTAIDIFHAIQDFVPGKAVPATAELRQNWFSRTFSGFTGVAGVMALAFGLLGLGGAYIKGIDATASGNFLEIAKIFAGAMVGGAATKR
ncbi:MAG TPA: hypothetical protein VFQ87_09440 [Bradyrhizobium sp.]|nr:hypothetical protein [Bradyrhizobium sp.]